MGISLREAEAEDEDEGKPLLDPPPEVEECFQEEGRRELECFFFALM